MAIRGRNASGLLNQKVSAEIPGNSGSPAPIFAAIRTSLFVKEAGVAITTGSAATNGTIGGKLHPSVMVQVPGASAVLLASISGTTVAVETEIAVGAVVGSEYTTRDGTFKFADYTASSGPNYQNASERVFPKGTKIYGSNTSVSGGAAGDKASVYIQVEEFGAPPA